MCLRRLSPCVYSIINAYAFSRDSFTSRSSLLVQFPELHAAIQQARLVGRVSRDWARVAITLRNQAFRTHAVRAQPFHHVPGALGGSRQVGRGLARSARVRLDFEA